MTIGRYCQPRDKSIFAAGSAGKCVTPTPPAIFAQPVNQKVIAGDDTSFSVLAGGAPPLSYQWSFEGTSIAGATAPTLTLTNVQPAQAGVYAVTITNSLGSLLSSNATLTVNFPPARVWLPDASAPAGNLLGDSLLTVPVYLVANGNENALGFSLNFSPSLLGNVSVALGSAASGGALLVNTNAAPNGTLGIALALPTGATFPPGTQEVADVVFAVSAQTNGSSTPITFGDLPIARQLSDASGQMLAASFSGGTVTVSVAFEGDASPRPNGDNDVTITDWVLLGRYAARLDYPTNGSEFQRADCAPRTTLGDGHITVADWVQAGRYAARLDPQTVAGGPTSEVATAAIVVPKLRGVSARKLSVSSTLLTRGQTGAVSVELVAQGDENALGFSLGFDPAIVAYRGAGAAGAAGGATMQVNATQAASGRLGFVLALPAGRTFAAGSRQVVNVSFSAPGSESRLFTDCADRPTGPSRGG